MPATPRARRRRWPLVLVFTVLAILLTMLGSGLKPRAPSQVLRHDDPTAAAKIGGKTASAAGASSAGAAEEADYVEDGEEVDSDMAAAMAQDEANAALAEEEAGPHAVEQEQPRPETRAASEQPDQGASVPAEGDFPDPALLEEEQHAGPAAAEERREAKAPSAAAAADQQVAAKAESSGGLPAAPGKPVPLSDAVPKVALMFLTRGPLPHSRVWDEWLKGVDGGVVPIPALTRLGCSQEQVELVQEQGAAPGNGGDSSSSPNEPLEGRGSNATLYERQRLFSIYVHAPPGYNVSYNVSSIFRGREAKKRVPTQWGTHSLVTAVRHMVGEALQDPLNQRFMLMSESDIPLWPAGLTYLQVMAEPASRVDACAPKDEAELKRLEPAQADVLKIPHDRWRKSSQWFVINRRHAELFTRDQELNAVFEKNCWVRRDMVTWKWRDGDRWCVSDEHYLPVLLAQHGEQGACSCSFSAHGRPRATPVYTQWLPGIPHPKTFTAAELAGEDRQVLEAARGCTPIIAEAALSTYADMLVSPVDWTQQACEKAAAQATADASGSATESLPPPTATAGEGAEGAEQAGAAAAAAGWQPALLPPYMCFLTLRKAAADAAEPLAQAVKAGRLDAQ